MTGYTPIYNLPYPQASDLVSAYPGTGQDLAEEVETVLAAKAPLASPALTGTPTAPTAADGTNTTQIATTAFASGATALSKVGLVSGSAAVLSINNCFSGTYESYRIIGRLTGTAGADLHLRLRNAGTDLTSSVYQNASYRVSANNTSGIAFFNTGATVLQVMKLDGDWAYFAFDLVFPSVGQNKVITGTGCGPWPGASITSAQVIGGRVQNTGTYDGLSFFASSGNIVGDIRVYAYKS